MLGSLSACCAYKEHDGPHEKRLRAALCTSHPAHPRAKVTPWTGDVDPVSGLTPWVFRA